MAEAEKAKLEIDPIDGPGIEKMVNELYEIEPAVVSRVWGEGAAEGNVVISYRSLWLAVVGGLV